MYLQVNMYAHMCILTHTQKYSQKNEKKSNSVVVIVIHMGVRKFVCNSEGVWHDTSIYVVV